MGITKLNIFVDIDETICFYNSERIYKDAIPNYKNIAKINKLYDEGHEITYWTARGFVTGLDWKELTKKCEDLVGKWKTIKGLSKKSNSLAWKKLSFLGKLGHCIIIIRIFKLKIKILKI